MNNIKYFIGPMSKNIVDTIIEFCEDTQNKIAFIPSRRQIEWNGGYVNKWTTENFSKYASSLLLQRDHAGPNQGINEDDGYESLKNDCNYLDLIHIDPWKKYPALKEGSEETANMIKYCYSLDPQIQYEIGTEESIRRFEINELIKLIKYLQNKLDPKIFNQIKYLVIQSGTSLKGTNQTGTYDSNRLKKMIEVCKQFNMLSKEHNGDYIPVSIIFEKFNLGLDAINIAPEFGLIETQTYLNEIKDNKEIFDRLWKICFDSKKWEKWVSNDFDPYIQKEELIKICGHYVLSYPEFNDIKSNFPNIDNKIKTNIKNKLTELYGFKTQNYNM
jgi:hypothetical protein